MEAYPSEYVEHNLPLVVLSGLGEQHDVSTAANAVPRQEGGTRLQIQSPECSGEQAQQVLQQFRQYDGSNQPWNASALPGPSDPLMYRTKATGRTYTLPPRKAAPLPQPTSSDGFQNQHGSPPRTELHSPLSPLSPGSPIFPDGVFTPLWFTKQQEQLPAMFIAFFNISASGDTSQDEQLKTDINAIRTSLNRSGFKTRFAAVLISDSSILHAPRLEERLSSVRRLTSLDSKSGLFFMPPMTSWGEIATFVQSVTTTLQPLIVEHFRDLTKHSRRKKARAGSQPSVSSPIGAGLQSLSTPGWNVRYEVKQGIFAEFRQEMDVAERHYSAAIDELFNPEGIFEATPSWSPRWDEARLLCDCLALRVLRCLLWSSSTTNAAKSWVDYKARMKDLIDRRGKGSQTYGWEAWETRWAQVMAQLVQRADLPALRTSSQGVDESEELSSQKVYAMPEKAFASVERIPPLHYLHHSGYWMKLAIRASQARRKKALEIPEEDRVPPGQSPASFVANRTRNYDCYLVPDPHEEYPLPGNDGYDHVVDLAKLTKSAWQQFQNTGQTRMAEMLKMDLAYDLQDAERYSEAMEILIPLWQETTWRHEDWHDIFADLLLLLRRCAIHENDAEALLSTTYELLSIQATLPNDLSVDLYHCQDGMQLDSVGKISYTYKNGQRLCPVSVSFAFDSKETHVGESVGCQLTLISRANKKAARLSLSNVLLSFGGSKSVKIVHDSEYTVTPEELIDLTDPLEVSEGTMEMKADLSFVHAQRRLYNFSLTPREAEVLRIKQASITIETDRFVVEHTLIDENIHSADSIFAMTGRALERRLLRHIETTAVTVLPKPPKVRILLNGLRKQFYTDEVLRIEVEIVNDELDAVEAKLSVHLRDEMDVSLSLQWGEAQETSKPQRDGEVGIETPVERTIPRLEPTASHTAILLIKAPSEPLKTAAVISVNYALSENSATPLRKDTPLDLSFVFPFDVRFNFGPLLYRDSWPSYFSLGSEGATNQSKGIPQVWRLSSQIRSLATDSIVLHKVEPIVDNVVGESHAKAYGQDPDEESTLEAGKIVRHSFELHTQKVSLDDRRTTTIESTLAISWSHAGNPESVTTLLPVPQLTLPASEPRVLCTLDVNAPSDCDAMIQYHIENPSTHFLTFALTMEASEDFSFSGPKYGTLSLAPLSRHRVEYRIAMHDEHDSSEEGHWIWPLLQIIDSYYQKALRIHPGGPDVKLDEKQNIGVWIGSP